jgi:hypothetical protein
MTPPTTSYPLWVPTKCLLWGNRRVLALRPPGRLATKSVGIPPPLAPARHLSVNRGGGGEGGDAYLVSPITLKRGGDKPPGR